MILQSSTGNKGVLIHPGAFHENTRNADPKSPARGVSEKWDRGALSSPGRVCNCGFIRPEKHIGRHSDGFRKNTHRRDGDAEGDFRGRKVSLYCSSQGACFGKIRRLQRQIREGGDRDRRPGPARRVPRTVRHHRGNIREDRFTHQKQSRVAEKHLSSRR